MKYLACLLAVLCLAVFCGLPLPAGQAPEEIQAGRLAQISVQLREELLDPEACFEIRDFVFRRGEARLFLNDGYLIFRKPIFGQRLGAVYVAREELEDAELLLIPPNRLERQSLATYTGAPTLNERFRLAAFLFTDGTGEEWMRQLSEPGIAKRRPERGVLLAEAWNPTMRNLSLSLESRLLEDVLNAAGAGRGFLFAAISGAKLGGFDLLFDPRAREEVLVGQVVEDNGRNRYDFWSHFEPRRQTPREVPGPSVKIRGYQVEARIDSELNFRARVEMQVEAQRAGVEVLPVELSPRLRLGAVFFNGLPVEHFQRDSLRANLLRMQETETSLVRFPKPLAAGQGGVLRFEEEGKIFFRAGNGVLYLATRTAWFPQVGWQAAPFTASFRHPKNLTLVCPGNREERVEGDEKVTTCKVEQAVRLFGFNLGDFERQESKRNGFSVELFANKRIEAGLERPAATIIVPPPPVPMRRRVDLPTVVGSTPMPPANPLARLSAMTEEISDALSFFQALLGPPPLPRLAAVPIPGAFGQGFPGFLYLSTLAFLEDRHMPVELRAEWQSRYFRDLLEAHEVAHQWWGNQVTFDSYRDEWLSEALANYSALLYLEKKKGSKALENVLEEYRRRLLRTDGEGKTMESAGPVVFGMRIRSSNPQAWQAITYEKSSWILHMLRGRLGDAAFLGMLGQLVKEFSTKPMRSEDLRLAAAARLPKGSPDPELLNFFDTWVYGTGVPQLTLSSVVKGVGPKAQVEISLTQANVPDSFEIDVPVEILLPKGRRLVRWIRTGKEPETVRVSAGGVPLKVQLDPKAPILRQLP